jgi:hypothetical protein
LQLVRERRAQQAEARIEKDGYDRFLPPGTPGGPPLTGDAAVKASAQSDSDSD